MKMLKVLVCMGLTVALVAGCSKKKRDEAAKLEQEMLAAESLSVDTVSAVDTMVDSAVVLADETDGSAVPPEEETRHLSLPPQPSGEGYTVQVAACESREYARYLVDLYTGRGYQPYVTEATIEGQVYYRVRVGQFGHLSDARSLREQLVDRYSIQPWVDHL